ncbi:hypothetical protein IWW50_005425 [Coemansia erecta]|nr:hypothetical protein IWW50_005425 [Coemansia erecta]
MKDEELDWIVTSVLDRAIETANCVAKHHESTPFVSDARLNEISWGELDGTKLADNKPVVDSVVQKWSDGDFDARIKGGESANESKARALEALADILKIARERKYRKVFVCIHGRIARFIMAALVDRDLCKMQRFTHTNCCYHQIRVEMDDDDTVVDPENLKFELVRMDVRDHLAEVAEVEPTDCRQL